MCFFKPKLPKIEMPQVAPLAPAIKETVAPEPNAPVFGGGSQELVDTGEASKRGVTGLKVPKLEKAAGIGTATGASKAGFNVYR